MKKLLSFSFSKIYIIVMILISLLVVGSYFSYAMFTVSKERSNAISIVTGNLIYDLTVDGEDIESLVVPAGTTKVFTVTLSNPNNRIARFNFYYLGTLPDGVSTGYSLLNYGMVTPVETGINLEKEGTSGSSNTYRIVVVNDNENEITINLGVSVGLDYNNLTLPSNGHLFEPVKKGPVGDVVVTNPGENGSTYDDEVDTFLTGEEPDNYIWYSGKLWRAVSVNDEDNTVKLVTQWNISAIPYDNDSSSFEGSYMEEWLNDTSVDGFLYNLRDHENFLVTDYKWNATMMTTTDMPPEKTMVTSAAGLLNFYEYSICGGLNSYLNNKLSFWFITPYDNIMVRTQSANGKIENREVSSDLFAGGIRPTIVLKSNIEIEEGNGTEDNPYRLKGDNDKDLNGVKLNTRYSGEYISFGNEPNSLYRIVSHEIEGLTKVTNSTFLKSGENAIITSFGSSPNFSVTSTIGSFLNGEYLNNYLTEENKEMVSNSTLWYLGKVTGSASYKLAKYRDINNNVLTTDVTNASIGLLRLGELMAGQMDKVTNSICLLTPRDSSLIRMIDIHGNAGYSWPTGSYTMRPTLNLKENVHITGGTGTKEDPFTIESGISIKYSAHNSDIGWQDYESDDNISGTSGEGKNLEAIKITMNDSKGLSGDVEYRVHVKTDGWKSYVKNDEIAGTTGENKGIEAIQIRLTGELAEQYDIYYNVYIIGTGWQGYKKNDEVAGTTGASKRIEAIKIKLVEKS